MDPGTDPQIAELTSFLEHYQDDVDLHPILWIGPGASEAAGYPTATQIEALLRKRLPGSEATGPALAEAFVDRFSEADFIAILQRQLGEPRASTPLHTAVARLAGAGVCPVLFTTNYDRLLETALGERGIPFVVQALEANFTLQSLEGVQLLKLQGDAGDWASAILASIRPEERERSYPLLARQLDLSLRTRPVIFVGCSLDDPWLLSWLRGLSEKERRGLYASRAVLLEEEWERLPAEVRELLAATRVKPILVPDAGSVERLLLAAARKLAPLDPGELVFDVTPGAETWTVVGPTPESAPHVVPSPLADSGLLRMLGELREGIGQPVLLDDPKGAAVERVLLNLARRLGDRLTEILLSGEARGHVERRIHQVDRGRARLTIRVRDAGPEADRALALPWELLTPTAGKLAVHDRQLDVVREAVTDGAPGLEKPAEALKVTVAIAAPEDQGALDYEKEAYRLYLALSQFGQQVKFTDLGTLDDLVDTVARQGATAVHFTGHGLPGQLAFEDDLGFTQKVAVGEMVRRLATTLLNPVRAGTFPRLFFLASCHGASASRGRAGAEGSRSEREIVDEGAASLDEGPSTAAVLHRSGFVQVVGYFGPIQDALSTRAEEAFYEALARGETALQAVAEARASLDAPLDLDERRFRFPLGWTQLAVYHRGPDLPLAVPSRPGPLVRFREPLEVSGLPVLRFGFIGRRALLHRVRRRVKDGQRLIVLQGLGGLGKTALASHLLTRVFASDPRDQLILRCQGLESDSDPIAKLRAQAEDFGRLLLEIAGWDEEVKKLQEDQKDSALGFAAVVRRLRQTRPSLVLYADNVETLQVGPGTDDPRALGSWRPEAAGWWREMERLAQEGLVLASTRYAWEGLKRDAWIPIEPMSPADTLRLIDSFENLASLPRDVRATLAEKLDGHPRTVEYLDDLVADRLQSLGLGFEVSDPWADLIKPVLPEHSERISADLLLNELWKRLSEPARRHARSLCVLRVPAPWEVIVALGSSSTVNELIRASLLTLHRERMAAEETSSWVDRWGLQALVRDWIVEESRSVEEREIHVAAGRAYKEFMEKKAVRWSDQVEAIHHLHAAGLGDEAWPLTHEYVQWLRRLARYREALGLLATCEAVGVSGDRLASSLFLVAQMGFYLGERGPTLDLVLDQALALAEDRSLGVEITAFQGTLLEARGDVANAEAKLLDALRHLLPGEPNRAAALNELARVRIVRERPDDAEPLLREARGILEKTIGTVNPQYANVLNNLAAALIYQGKEEEVEGLLLQSLQIHETIFGQEHPFLSGPLTSLARFFASNGRAEEGEKLARRALGIILQVNGEEHPEVAMTLSILARTQSVQGKPEALETARRAIELFERLQMTDHAGARSAMSAMQEIVVGSMTTEDRMMALNSRIEASCDRGELFEAIALQQRLVDLLRDRRTRDGQQAFCLELRHLARLQSRAGLHQEAFGSLEQAVSLGESVDHPNLEAIKQALRLEEIIIGLMKHLEEGGFATDPVDVATFREADEQTNKAIAARDRGALPEAIRYAERAIELYREVNDTHSLKVKRLRNGLFGLGELYRQAGRNEEAAAASREAATWGSEEDQ